MSYSEDVLKNGFEQKTLFFPNDYEGIVTSTLIRKKNTSTGTKAILCIHGFNDYFFQEILAEEFLKNGYHFYALDLRKYGRSILKHQKLNNVRNLSEYYEDIDKALTLIQEEGSTEIILYGHSTGGLIVTLYSCDRKGKELFDVLICNSPFYDFNVPKFQKITVIPILAFLGRINPNLPLPISFSHFYGKSLHANDFGEWNYSLKWKPHVAPSINAGWVNAIYQGHKRISNGIVLNKPILILHSYKTLFPKVWSETIFEADIILNVEDIKSKSDLIFSKQKEIVAIKGAIHDMVLSRKPIRDTVFKVIFDWVSKFI